MPDGGYVPAVTIPTDADPDGTPGGIRPFAGPAPLRSHLPIGPGRPTPPIPYPIRPGRPARTVTHRPPPVTAPIPRYRGTDRSAYSPPVPSRRAPAAPVPTLWIGPDHCRRRARYWWLASVGGVLVLAAIGAGVFWLLPDDDSEPRAGVRISAYGLTYQLPAGWAPRPPADLPWARDLLATGIGTGPEFDCGGRRRARGVSGVLMVYRNDGRPPAPADAATALGRSFAHTIYGADASVASVDGGPAGPGRAGVRLAAVAAPDAACPIRGQIDAVALPGVTRNPAGQPTVRVFLLQHDTSGGPANPAPPSAREVRAVLASLRVTGSAG